MNKLGIPEGVMLKGLITVIAGVVLWALAIGASQYRTVTVLQSVVQQQTEQIREMSSRIEQLSASIESLRDTRISYHNFYLLTRTFELQQEEIMAIIDKDNAALLDVQARYRELRQMIIQGKY